MQDLNHDIFEAIGDRSIADILIKEGRVLGFRINSDRASGQNRLFFRQIDHFLQRGNFVEVVENGVSGTDGGDPLSRTQSLDLRQREVVGRIDSDGWAIWGPDGGGTGRNQSLVARLKSPMTAGEAPLRFVIHQNSGDSHTLGRFRLSFTEDTAALDRERQRLATQTVVDPRLKLAAAYDISGKTAEGLKLFMAEYDRATDYEARQPIVEIASRSDRFLSALVKAHPEDGQLQLALARRLAQRGQDRLAALKSAEARADLANARDIYRALRELTAEAQWNVIAPVELNSESGARFELQPDGSVFVQQPDATKPDTFTLSFPAS